MAAMDCPDTVKFNVGGSHFEVLSMSILSQPDTLLWTLMDNEKDWSKPIFVNHDGRLFPYILAWYRQPSRNRIACPITISSEEMREACKFFQLPDDVTIAREEAWDALPAAVEALDAELSEKRAAATKLRMEAESRCRDAFVAYHKAMLQLAAAYAFEKVLIPLGSAISNNDRQVLTTKNSLSFPQTRCFACGTFRLPDLKFTAEDGRTTSYVSPCSITAEELNQAVNFISELAGLKESVSIERSQAGDNAQFKAHFAPPNMRKRQRSDAQIS